MKVVTKRKKTIFFPAKSRKLAAIVDLTSPAAARRSTAKLMKMFRAAKTRARKVKLKRAVVLAANRAFAAMKRRGLSAKEKKQLMEVGRVFRAASKRMKL